MELQSIANNVISILSNAGKAFKFQNSRKYPLKTVVKTEFFANSLCEGMKGSYSEFHDIRGVITGFSITIKVFFQGWLIYKSHFFHCLFYYIRYFKETDTVT